MLRTARRASQRYYIEADSSEPRLWEPQIHNIRKYGTGGAHKDIIPVNLILWWPTGVGVNRNYFKVTLSRVMTQGSLVHRYGRFGETCCMHFLLAPKWSLLCGPKIRGSYDFLILLHRAFWYNYATQTNTFKINVSIRFLTSSTCFEPHGCIIRKTVCKCSFLRYVYYALV